MNTEKELRFKTSISCSGCIAAVKPFIEKVVGEQEWSVDTTDRDKLLTVRSSKASVSQIVDAVKEAGYKIEPVA